MTEVIGPGTYQLEDDNGNVLTNTWNIEQLRRFSPKFGLTAFLTHAPVKAPQPKHFQPGLLGYLSFFYYHMVLAII